jgi:hypothetical protein
MKRRSPGQRRQQRHPRRIRVSVAEVRTLTEHSDVSLAGAPVVRCAHCGKVVFTDEAAAQRATQHAFHPMLAYWSTDCGVWHPSTARRHLEWSEAA